MTLPARHQHGLVWYVDQAAAGYFQRIIHTLDYSSLAVCVPPVVVVFAACGAAAIPLPEDSPPLTGWRYCTSPLCWQQRTVEK
ncbi:hypothetical protein ACSHWB_26225 [Lentzea sp. HUAS TT2]|uniref:hypothetical protein n=1 Tax=Lentzea sp. HUAS TT2 TaxID=3447454 RepID=UPI003F6F30C0